MKKRILTFFCVIALSICFIPNTVFASATAINENFDANVLPTGWVVESYNAGSTVTTQDGKITVSNVVETGSYKGETVNVGATEIKLPDIGLSDYVIEFDATRISGDESFSLKYRLDENYEKGYELRVHFPQWIAGGGCYTDVYLDDYTGKAFENWEVNVRNLKYDYDIGKLVNVGCFDNELYVGEKFTYRVEVTGDTVEFYVNDELYLKDYLEKTTDGGRTALRVAGETTVEFDNFKTYTLTEYAEKKLADTPTILADQDEITLRDYKLDLLDTQKYLDKCFSASEQTSLNGYDKLTQAKADIETKYGYKELRKPIISVDWNLVSSFNANDSVKIPKGTAVDGNNQTVYVTNAVMFNGKIVKQDENGYISANEAGKYTVVYTATNFYGESVTKEYTFTVNAPPADYSIVLLIAGLVFVLGGASLAVMFFTTKKVNATEIANKGEDDNEKDN